MMSKSLVRAAVCAALGVAVCVSVPVGLRWFVPAQAVSAAAPFATAARPAPESAVPAGPTKLLRYADISKDAVVFSYAGDLWSSSRQGGAAHRLTSGPGDKLYPKYSPDGKWIAFTASMQGGLPTVLPVPRGDLTTFSPDGNKIAYIESSQENRTWKRYRGGWSLPIAIYDLKKNTYEELPKSAGLDLFLMCHDNTLYFTNE